MAFPLDCRIRTQSYAVQLSGILISIVSVYYGIGVNIGLQYNGYVDWKCCLKRRSTISGQHRCYIHVVRCSGKFVAPENYSRTQQYGLGLRLKIGLNLGLGLELAGLRLGLGLALALVTLWQYGGGKNFPAATNFPRHRLSHSCTHSAEWNGIY